MAINWDALKSKWNKLVYGWSLDDIGKEYCLFIDVSHWIVIPNKFDEEKFVRKMKELNLRGIVFKATDATSSGVQFVDSTAEFWYSLAKKHNLLVGCYHWLQPSVDPSVAGKYYLDFLKDHPCDLPPIVDFEEPSVTNATDYLWRLSVILETLGKDTIVYTGTWYISKLKPMIPQKDWAKKLSWISAYSLWIAYYSRYLPKGLYPWSDSDWKLWQYTDKADFPFYLDEDGLTGTEWGFQAHGLDMNFVKVDYLKSVVDGFDNQDQGQAEEEQKEEEMLKMVVKANVLNVRKAPSKSGVAIRQILKNGIVTVYDVGGKSSSWVKISPDQEEWCCVEDSYAKYLEKC